MRVHDTEMAIYHNLRSLPWLAYLGAMGSLCEMLKAQYLKRLTESELGLMDQTLRLVATTVRCGDPASEYGPARQLAKEWSALVDNGTSSALPGQWNTWWTFQALAAEIAGTAKRYAGAERVLLAATERWREPYPGRARRIDPDEEAPDSSGLAQTLAAFDRVVTTALALSS